LRSFIPGVIDDLLFYLRADITTVLLFVCFFTPAVVIGQEFEEGTSTWQSDLYQEYLEQRNSTSTSPMSDSVHLKLFEVNSLVDAGQYEQGLTGLKNIEAMPNLNSYERIQVFNYLAYIYFVLDRYQDALGYYERILAEPDTAEVMLLNTYYGMAQAYFLIQDYPKAVVAIERWFADTPEPTLNACMLLGQAYYQMERYQESLSQLLQARAMSRQSGGKPKELLLLLLQNIYIKLNDYPKLIAILKELIITYPKSEHWFALAAAYSEVDEFDKQLSILEMLYESGNLEDGQSQLNLVNLYLMHKAPYKAAVLLDTAIKQGKIEGMVNNLELLARAWQQAHELEKSLQPLEQAARLAEDGDVHIRLAQSYISLNMYEAAAAAVAEGMDKGSIDRPDQANLILGMALFELEKFDAAKAAFATAIGDNRSKNAAEDWVKYVESEQVRKQELESGL